MAEKDRDSAPNTDGRKQEAGKKRLGTCEVCGGPVTASKNSKARQIGTSWVHTPCAVRSSARS